MNLPRPSIFACAASVLAAVFSATGADDGTAYLDGAISGARLASLAANGPTAVADCEAALDAIAAAVPPSLRDTSTSFRAHRIAKRLEVARSCVAFARENLSRGDAASLGFAERALGDMAAMRRCLDSDLTAWKVSPDNPAVEAAILDVRDFGAVGDGAADNAPAFRAALGAVRALNGRPCILRIPPGRYLLCRDGAETQTAARGFDANILCEGLSNLAICGESAETTALLFGAYDANGFTFASCTNCTLRGISLQYAEAPFGQGEVVATDFADANSPSLTIRLVPGTLAPTDPRYAKALRPNVCALFDAAGRQVFMPYVFFDGRADDLGGGLFRVFLDPSRWNASAAESIVPGTVFVIPDRRHALSAVRADDSLLCAFDGVSIRNSRAGAFTLFGSFFSTVWRCRIESAEPGLVLSANADGCFSSPGTHMAYCDFRAMNDDGANCHTNGRQIRRIDAERRSIVTRADTGTEVRPGDIVQVMRPATGEVAAQLRVASQRLFDEEGTGLAETFFDGKVPDGVGASNTIFFPMSFGAGFVCCGNRFRSLRNIAIQVQCPNALVEGNVVENIAHCICVSALMNHWFEGPAPYNVTIRGNTAHDALRAVSVGIYALGKTVPQHPAIRGLTLLDNRFSCIANRPAMKISNAADVILAGNTLDGEKCDD